MSHVTVIKQWVPAEVWSTTIDGRWRVQMCRTGDRDGLLRVWLTRDPNIEILRERVQLRTAPQFVPDDAEIGEWLHRALKVIDVAAAA